MSEDFNQTNHAPIKQDSSWFSVEQLYIAVAVVIVIVGIVVGSGH